MDHAWNGKSVNDSSVDTFDGAEPRKIAAQYQP